MSIQLDLSKHPSIPKVIHISWKTKDILDNQSPLILNGVANMKKINPEYQLEISDDNDVDNYLKQHLSSWDYFKIKNKKIVEKIDLWRLYKLYNEGGIYVDLDRYCNIPFDSIIKKGTKCILPTHGDMDFSQDIMISCRENPIFKRAIELNLQKRWLINPRGVFHLGPPLYMRAVTEIVFGKSIKRKSGAKIMDDLRKQIQNSLNIQTYRENLPNDSLIFKYDKNSFLEGNGMDKEAFYNSQKIVPWSKGWDTNTLILLAILIFSFICYSIFLLI